jgi:FtsZ-binding cell division protein ZapB
MADVNVKTIETRLQLKYDTYANWTNENLGDNKGAKLVLLPGEIGICTIGDTAETGSAHATTNPTVLFKVGDGVTPFKTLKWASALAADVYGWAKAETVSFNATNKRVEFKTGEDVIHHVDLSHFAEASTVSDHNTRIADIEAVLGLLGGEGEGEGDGENKKSIPEQIADIVEKLGVIQGADTVEGSIAKALKDAKAYTDEVVGTKADGETAATGLRKEIADAQAAAVASANANTATEVGKLNAKDAELAGEITRVEGLVTTEATNRENADKAITDIIGEGLTTTDTVAVKVKAAQDAADAAQADVDALVAENGAVTKNTADIAQLKSDLSTETSERKAADKALDDRLKEVEAFFEGAAKDGEGLDNALDKLVEIQEYLSGDGTAAGDLVGQVSANAQAIKTLQDTLADGGDFEKRVDAVEASASANAGNIKTLQDLTAGDYGEGTIKDAIDAAAAKGQKGIDDAKSASDAAKAAQDDVDALALVVNNETTGLVATKKIADDNAAALATLIGDNGRVKAAEDAIDALELIVNDTSKGNDQLRTDVNALQTLTGDAAKGNEALYTEVTRVAGLVDNTTTGLAATKKIADDNATAIAEIKADYLKASDVYVFKCGSSTTVTYTVPTEN